MANRSDVTQYVFNIEADRRMPKTIASTRIQRGAPLPHVGVPAGLLGMDTSEVEAFRNDVEGAMKAQFSGEDAISKMIAIVRSYRPESAKRTTPP